MFPLKSIESMNKAIERARASRLVVRRTSIKRMYRVENLANGKSYTVNFFVRRDGARFGTCDCPATTICKHIASASALCWYDATVRRAAAMVEQMPEAA
jgi:uncharacterized Zn finger protein